MYYLKPSTFVISLTQHLTHTDINIQHCEKQLLGYIENPSQIMVYADSTLKGNSGVRYHYDHNECQSLSFLLAQYEFLLNNIHSRYCIEKLLFLVNQLIKQWMWVMQQNQFWGYANIMGCHNHQLGDCQKFRFPLSIVLLPSAKNGLRIAHGIQNSC